MTFHHRTQRTASHSNAHIRKLAAGASIAALGAFGLQTLAHAQITPNSPTTSVLLDGPISALEPGALFKVTQSFDGADAVSSASGIASTVAAPGAALPELVVVSESEGRNGQVHMRLRQEVDGLRVYGADVKATREGDALRFVTGRTANTQGLRLPARVDEAFAISIAVAEHHGEAANADGYWFEPPKAERVLIPRGQGLEEGFLVQTWSEGDNMLHETLVNSTGRVVESIQRTSDVDRFRVYENSPTRSSLVDRNAPEGWVDADLTQYNILIQGNNIAAYRDLNANNQPDGDSAQIISDGDFRVGHSPNSAPTTLSNQQFAVQNIFYMTNRMHDQLYDHGFVESAGNFQEDNFGRGGAGGDSVLVEVQDGSGTNNANFATPSDGNNPRMQMYIWTLTNPNRDSALDSDIVWHEYGHGLTWRMIGNMSGAISGAIGEGMSDTLAFLKNRDDAVGEYSLNNTTGVRSERYTGYSRTIGDFTGSSVHFDGEIYGGTMWKLSELFGGSLANNNALLDILVDGMNFTPSQPTYLDMRDGILAAAPNNRDCLVWQAFAEFGMGEDAVFDVSGNSVSIGESFDVPSQCDDTAPETPSLDVSMKNLIPIARAQKNGRWRAVVRVVLQGDDRAGRNVVADWSDGTEATCTTNQSGRCTLQLRNQTGASARLTIRTVAGAAPQGSPTTVTVQAP